LNIFVIIRNIKLRNDIKKSDILLEDKEMKNIELDRNILMTIGRDGRLKLITNGKLTVYNISPMSTRFNSLDFSYPRKLYKKNNNDFISEKNNAFSNYLASIQLK